MASETETAIPVYIQFMSSEIASTTEKSSIEAVSLLKEII